MAFYEVPDELTLAVVKQQFPNKFLTLTPKPRRVGLPQIHICGVCVPHVHHVRNAGPFFEAMDDGRGFYLLDKPTELYNLMPRDMAEQSCPVCLRTMSAIEENGCGYDKRKHG